jgi:hypothetical protein
MLRSEGAEYMHKVNVSQVPVEGNPPSPRGRFRSFSQNISIALGHIKENLNGSILKGVAVGYFDGEE